MLVRRADRGTASQGGGGSSRDTQRASSPVPAPAHPRHPGPRQLDKPQRTDRLRRQQRVAGAARQAVALPLRQGRGRRHTQAALVGRRQGGGGPGLGGGSEVKVGPPNGGVPPCQTMLREKCGGATTQTSLGSGAKPQNWDQKLGGGGALMRWYSPRVHNAPIDIRSAMHLPACQSPVHGLPQGVPPGVRLELGVVKVPGHRRQRPPPTGAAPPKCLC